ncbi:hypothetical protein FRC07_005051 [Ceratobasidium sp. 392]|nr:hypothetical protein FRC07_005051 [Ceratobasidium sp. 392]
MVKAFIEHFQKPATCKQKAVKYKKSNKRRRVELPVSHPDTQEGAWEDQVEFVIDEGDASNSTSNAEDESPTTLIEEGLDEDKMMHDACVIKETTTKAIKYPCEILKLSISDSMWAIARGVLNQASASARRLHDSLTLQAKFESLIDATVEHLKTNRRALARRISTQWNSDYKCLLSRFELKPCVQMLTAESDNSLQHLALSDAQWEILSQLLRVLKIFKKASDLFSRAEVPLVHEVVPMFIRIRHRLEVVRDDSKHRGLHPLIRAAAQSALLVYEKYMDSFASSEVYWIALVMCPHYKLQWLHDHGFSSAQVDSVCDMVINRFNVSYKVTPANSATGSNFVESSNDSDESDDEWSPVDALPRPDIEGNSIENYLRTEPVSRKLVKLAGGPLRYWEAQKSQMSCPELAQFALDYLSAPASSVDAERAFSSGRLMTNHLQHQMSDDTFRAKMALRLWYKTPLLPEVSEVASLLANRLSGLTQED